MDTLSQPVRPDLVVPTQHQASSEETRRQVTVLFCDLVGSTQLSGQLDPEELRDLLSRYQNAAAEALESYGGRLHFTLGDGLMASWGWPRAREDDAARAVLAGLSVVQAIDELAVTLAGDFSIPFAPSASPAIEVRVAVHSGLAVIADSTIGSRREVANLIGETPNLTARLQSVAEPGTVVMSDATEDLVRGRFETRALGEVPLKGVQRSVRAFVVTGTADVEGATAAPRGGGRVVGRAAEVRLLEQAWRQASSPPRAQVSEEADAARVLLLSGAAGIGKSHLVDHLRRLAAADGGDEALIRCSSLQSNHAFYAIRRMIERMAGIAPDDSAVRRRERMADFFISHPALAATDSMEALAALVGAPDRDTPAVLNPEQLRERTFAVLLDLLDSLAERRPLLIVVEDAHWADPSTSEFLRCLLDRGPAPRALVLVTSRDNDAVPPSTARLELAPLAPEGIAEILAAAVPSLPEALRQLAVERADGVPLFAEELGRMLLREGASPSELPDVPPRLQDLLVARLDERPDERPLLQLVATIGTSAVRSFVEQVADRSSDEVRQSLGVLVQSGVLTDDGPAHDPVYRFQHVLLRDAAYSTLLRSSRRHLHRRIAQALLPRSDEDWLQRDLLAHHFEQAGDLAASAVWWYRAALGAAAVAAHHEVVTHLRHALDLLGDNGPIPDVPELEIHVLLGISLGALEGYTSEEVARVHQRAQELLDESPDGEQRPGFFYPLWAYHHVRGDLETSSALSEQLWQLAGDDLGEQATVAAAMVGYDAFEQGLLDRALEFLQIAQRPVVEPLPDTQHEQWPAATVLLGVTRWLRGDRIQGRADVHAAVQRADELGMPKGAFTRAFVHSYAAWARLLDDDPHQALAHSNRAMQEAQTGGYTSWFAAACMHLAGAQARTGDPAGVPTLQGMLAAWRAGGAEVFRPVFLAWLGEAHRADGDLPSARLVLTEGIEHAQEFGGRVHEPELHRLRAQVDAELGRRDAALEGFGRAAALASRQGEWSLAVRASADLVELTRDDPAALRALEAATARVIGAPDEPDTVRARRLLAR